MAGVGDSIKVTTLQEEQQEVVNEAAVAPETKCGIVSKVIAQNEWEHAGYQQNHAYR